METMLLEKVPNTILLEELDAGAYFTTGPDDTKVYMKTDMYVLNEHQDELVTCIDLDSYRTLEFDETSVVIEYKLVKIENNQMIFQEN